MDEKRKLNFQSADEVIADVERLRGGYRKLGNWSLPQMTYHLAVSLRDGLSPPEPMDLPRTPEQEAMKAGFVDYVMAGGAMKPEWQATDEWVPPESCDERHIDEFISLLKTMRDYPHPRVMMGPLGPVTIEEYRGVDLAHAAHHLRYLVPTSD